VKRIEEKERSRLLSNTSRKEKSIRARTGCHTRATQTMPSFVDLASKPGVEFAYNFTKIRPSDGRGDNSSDVAQILVVFINGLMLPMAAWTPALDMLTTTVRNQSIETPARSQGKQSWREVEVATLTYDRLGQGETRSHAPLHPHDLTDSVEDLHALLATLIPRHYAGAGNSDFSSRLKLVFVAHSIGVPLARLYCQTYSGTVTALLFLDSNIANSDFVSLFPDPDATSASAGESINSTSYLPDDATVDDLRALRNRVKATLHPSVANSEALDRGNLHLLLPHADTPTLTAPHGQAPWLTVVAHDPDAFAAEGLRLTGIPRGLNDKYLEPVWAAYNRGLLQLTQDPARARGVVVAHGAGHLVQRDNPSVVVEEIMYLVERIVGES